MENESVNANLDFDKSQLIGIIAPSYLFISLESILVFGSFTDTFTYCHTNLFDQARNSRQGCDSAEEPTVTKSALYNITRLNPINNKLRIIEDLMNPQGIIRKSSLAGSGERGPLLKIRRDKRRV